ncbi:MAG: ferritin [Gemmatimonadales bacterium]
MARTKGMNNAINDQMAMEFHAAYLYLARAAWFEAQALPGFASWMRLQNQEEQGHALKLFQYLLDSGGQVELQGIPAAPKTFKSPLSVMKSALAHEQKVTASINKLYELAHKERDYPAQLELQWFITEQVEEERTVGDIIQRMELAGDNPAALLMIDHELGSRASA